jgi:hypothetical protein
LIRGAVKEDQQEAADAEVMGFESIQRIEG